MRSVYLVYSDPIPKETTVCVVVAELCRRYGKRATMRQESMIEWRWEMRSIGGMP